MNVTVLPVFTGKFLQYIDIATQLANMNLYLEILENSDESYHEHSHVTNSATLTIASLKLRADGGVRNTMFAYIITCWP